MKVAIPEWQGRVSPVFDVARHLMLFESEAGQARRCGEWDCETVDLSLRVTQLHATGATVLICGAISRSLEMAITATGIQIIAHICGDVQDVAAAYARGQITQATYCMPGCSRRQRRCRRSHGQRNV